MQWRLLIPFLLLTSALPVAGHASAQVCPYVIDPLTGQQIGCWSQHCPGGEELPRAISVVPCLLPPPPDPGETPSHYAGRVVAYYVCTDLFDDPPRVALDDCGPVERIVSLV